MSDYRYRVQHQQQANEWQPYGKLWRTEKVAQIMQVLAQKKNPLGSFRIVRLVSKRGAWVTEEESGDRDSTVSH